MTTLTLTQAEFDALPTWPNEKLPPPVVGNKWKFKVGPRWVINGYEDRGGFPVIVWYEEFRIVDEAAE